MAAESTSAEAGAELARYRARLAGRLGTREPLEVMAELMPALLQALANLSPKQIDCIAIPGTWTVRQVVEHLTDNELIVGFRIRLMLAHDDPEITGYDQELWADRLRASWGNLEETVEELAILRRRNLRLLRGLAAPAFDRAGWHRERGRESVGDLVRITAGHDLLHLDQIERIKTAMRDH